MGQALKPVKAGGGLVLQEVDGQTQTLLVHRPRYLDWSIPKGKADRGESFEACALREVEEETGLQCLLGEELAGVFYYDIRGRYKIVRYWLMEPESGEFKPHGEIDRVLWLPLDEAAEMVSYSRDAAVIKTYIQLYGLSGGALYHRK